MRHWMLLVALSCVPLICVAQSKGRPVESSGGMVITGDREAPLVLHIVPWQDPKAVVPPQVPLQPLIPVVVDSVRGVFNEPDNKPSALLLRER